jgi:hypothetical protein
MAQAEAYATESADGASQPGTSFSRRLASAAARHNTCFPIMTQAQKSRREPLNGMKEYERRHERFAFR